MGLNTAEGGTNGAAPDTNNTGGTSGDACSSVTVASGDTAVFSTAAAQHGSLGYRLSFAASGTGATRLSWTHTSSVRSIISFYVKINSVPTQIEDLATWRVSTTNVAAVYINASGKWAARDSVGGQAASLSTTSVVANHWYRVDLAAKKGTTTSNGTVGIAVFEVGSNTPIHSWESSALNVGTTDFTSCTVGRTTGRVEAHVVDYDTIRFQDFASGWLNDYTPQTAYQVYQGGTWQTANRYTRSGGTWV